MPDTSLGITYPASTDHTRLWEHMQALADDVNALLLRRPVLQSGSLSVAFTAQVNVVTNLTFPVAFTAAPRLVCQVVSSAGAAVRATVLVMSVTTTGAQIRTDLAASGTVTVSVHWIAVEP